MHIRWHAALFALMALISGTAWSEASPAISSAEKTPSGAPAKGADDEDKTPPFEIDIGPDVQTGKYGTRRRATVSSIDSKLDWDPFENTSLTLDVPYLWQRAPAGTIAGHSESHHVHVGAGKDISTDGIGDVTLGVDQTLFDQSDRLPVAIGVLGNVKLGTASVSKGLGSGKTDYIGQLHIAHTFERATFEVRGGYAFLGDPGHITVDGIAENVRYRDTWLSSFAGAYQFNHVLSVGGAFDAAQSPERRLGPADDISVNTSYQFHPHLGLRATALRGLTNSSPDWGGTVLLYGDF